MPEFVNRYKDKERALKLRNSQRKRYYKKNNFKLDLRKHHIFSYEDIKLILKKEISDKELAKLLGTSVQSIQIKRSRIRKGIKNNVATRVSYK